MAGHRARRLQRTAWGVAIAIGGALTCAVPSLWAGDNTPPSGTISINNGSGYTRNRLVTLSLVATDDRSVVSQMRFSNDGRSYAVSEPYAGTKAWTLAGGEGRKVVYVKFKDKAGNWSQPASASIVLDRITPVVAITYPTKGMLLRGS